MIWAIDIGNTQAASGILDDMNVVRRLNVTTESLRNNAGALRWAKRLKRAGRAEGVVLSSVVPAVEGPVETAIRRTFQANPLFVRPDLDLGLRLKVRHPQEVGADRIVNVLAARTLFGTPCIVVDFGTATTFDVVDVRGDYLGGAIHPGLGMSLRALHVMTAMLPDIRYRTPRAAIGRSTIEAMGSGVHYGAIGQVRELLLRIRKQLGSVAPAIATGGFCRVFGNAGIFHHIVPDLTLQGLSCAWKRLHG